MTQYLLTFTDPQLPEEAKPRIGSQNRTALDRLEQGSVTNVELEDLGIGRVNSRMADLRKLLAPLGQTISCTAVSAARGVYRYDIVSK